MDPRNAARGIRFGALASYLIAVALVILALVFGVREIVTGSAIGGAAVVLIALIMLAGIAWRVTALRRRMRSDA